MAKHLFDLDSSEKKMNELLMLYNDFVKDYTSTSKALHIATESWHLTDWVYSEFPFIHNYDKLGDFRESLYPLCNSLKIMHDIANSSKHGEVKRPKSQIQLTQKHLGEFSSEFSKEFDVTRLEIIFANGNKIYFEDEIKKVVDFWKDYFNDTLNISI